MQRLFVAERALAPDGNGASIAEPLHEAEEDHATIRNVFVSRFQGLVKCPKIAIAFRYRRKKESVGIEIREKITSFEFK